MIARVWRGYAKPEDAAAYESMLKPELLPGVGKAKGYIGSFLGKRTTGNEVEFITIMLWESLEAIQTIAGPEFEKAVVPEERRRYLTRYETESAHYEIASAQGQFSELG